MRYNTHFTAQIPTFSPNQAIGSDPRMKFLIEMLSVILFFAAYFLYQSIPTPIIETINNSAPISFIPGSSGDAIYFATLIGILVSGLVALLHLLRYQEIHKNKSFTFLAFLVLGGATIIFRDPAFIKWKPTVVNLAFALVFFASSFIGNKPLVERFMGNSIDAPKLIWQKLNIVWVSFFIMLAVLNLFVAYNFSEEFWVGFKLFGVIGLTILFIIMQMMWLSRYIIIKTEV